MSRITKVLAVLTALWLATGCTEPSSADASQSAPAVETTSAPTFAPASVTPAFLVPPRATPPAPQAPSPESQLDVPGATPTTGDGTAAPGSSGAGPAPSRPAPTAPVAPAAPGSPAVATGLAGRVASLPVAAEADAGTYDRDRFSDWIDVDSDGCHTRCEVLEIERRPDGTWYSIYDGVSTTDPSSFDIDHMVPLAEAWRSGASRWEAARRAAFANDLGNPQSLIAVTASSNRSKSDRDPARWMPPSQGSWCAYIDAWVTTKLAWGLTADPAESAALAHHAAAC